MLVSIIIDNFNYARFVGEAIESALAQTYPGVEVIVVDDGSTDGSREVIARYESRLQTVLKENGGQGSAFNAGFAASRGEIIIFLDADDLLHREAVERVVAAWDARCAKLHFKLTRIDGEGRVIGTEPRHDQALPTGELWRTFLERGRYLTPASSGNAYARWALAEVLPVPEREYLRAPDAYLNNSVVFCGPIAAIQEALGSYRIHGANASLGNGLTSHLPRLRYLMAREASNDRAFAQAALRHGLAADPEIRYRYYQRLKLRTLSWKVDRPSHPKPADSVRALAPHAWEAVWRMPDLSKGERLLQTLWFLLAFTCPPSWVLRFIEWSPRLKPLIRRTAPAHMNMPPPALGTPAVFEPLVSIIVNNYNYAAFVGEAIESALQQSYSRVEVIVVDDGSADGSREIIERYGARITPVFKENGGQGSAFNAGYVASRGEIVIFLDSDDLLHSDAVERIVQAWSPAAVKTHFVLTRVNPKGEAIGTEPRNHRAIGGETWLPEGELWRALARDGRYVTTATTGNAYARAALARVMPVPEPAYRISADAYFNNCIVFHGPVQAINEPLGIYRIHGANDSLGNGLSGDVPRMRSLMAREAANDAAFTREVERLQLGLSSDGRYRFHHRLKLRILSWKIDRAQHPKPADTLLSLARQAWGAVWLAPGLSLRERCLQTFWCLALLTFPRRAVLGLVANHGPLKRFLKPEAAMLAPAFVTS